jgi:transcriptional antiterminator Rof (Rho-off)
MDSDYQPIDCELHDRYESACVLRQLVCLEIEGIVTQTRILDVFQKDGAEFIRVESHESAIRLDQVQWIRMIEP